MFGTHCFGDRLGVGDVVLVRLHVGFDELRCHQAHGMTEPLQCAGPVMGTGASLHADQAWRQVREERRHLITPKLLAQHRSAALIDRVYLEHALCQIDANSRNLHGGRPFPVQVVAHTSTLALRCRLRVGASIPLLSPGSGSST